VAGGEGDVEAPAPAALAGVTSGRRRGGTSAAAVHPADCLWLARGAGAAAGGGSGWGAAARSCGCGWLWCSWAAWAACGRGGAAERGRWVPMGRGLRGGGSVTVGKRRMMTERIAACSGSEGVVEEAEGVTRTKLRQDRLACMVARRNGRGRAGPILWDM